MDENHSVEENLEKIKALIDAVHKLYSVSNELTFSALLFQVETLKTLSEETFESLERVSKLLKVELPKE